VTPHERKIAAIVSGLLGWFSARARDLPWRRTRDPYAIWVSEVMLQQTQVKTVVPYWERWMRELPTIEAAAKASPDQIHKLWEGLGYYSRARNLQQAARQIMERHDGQFPRRFEDVLALPGIGRYTAGAICSIAFNQPTPVLDGNVIRVLARVFGIGENPKEKETKAKLWELAEQFVMETSAFTPLRGDGSRQERAFRQILVGALHSPSPCPSPPGEGKAICRRSPTNDVRQIQTLDTPEDRRMADVGFDVMHSRTKDDWPCSHFNQSLMELGALVCLPRNPQCKICPVKGFCRGFREGRVQALPNLGKRPAATPRYFVAFVVERKGRFLVRQRPAGVVNGHLWEFPNAETESLRGDDTTAAVRMAAQLFGSAPMSILPFCTIKHSITRYRIRLAAFLVRLKNPSPGKAADRLAGTGLRSQATARLALAPPKTKPKDSLRRGIAGQWRTLPELEALAFSSAHKRILRELKANR
jgi:adenine-specific DNA glycosylase